jgi:hypothetical protein
MENPQGQCVKIAEEQWCHLSSMTRHSRDIVHGSEPIVIRVFTEVTFWNSAEYGIFCGSDIAAAEFLY